MTIIISSQGPNGGLTIADGITDVSLSLGLVGRGSPGYATTIANNTYRQLCNFSGDTAPQGVTPLVGQLWFDTSNSTLKVYVSGAWTDLFGSASTSGSSGSLNFLRSDASSGPTNNGTFDLGTDPLRFRTIFANTFDGVATSAKYADVAERYHASEPVEPGDVVMIGGVNEIQKTYKDGSFNVFGVISTNPGFKMNVDAGDDTTHPFVALSGRTPVKVIGRVRKGQRLIASSTSGVARAVELDDIINSFQVIGRSLSDKDTTDIALVEIVIGAK